MFSNYLSNAKTNTRNFFLGEDIDRPAIPKMIDYNEAFRQAEQALNPQFNKAMGQMDRGNISRGFYGQLPADVMKNELRQNQIGQTANYAQNLRQNQFGNDMQSYGYQMQDYNDRSQGLLNNPNFWGSIGSIAGSALGGPFGGALGNWAGSKLSGSLSPKTKPTNYMYSNGGTNSNQYY